MRRARGEVRKKTRGEGATTRRRRVYFACENVCGYMWSRRKKEKERRSVQDERKKRGSELR